MASAYVSVQLQIGGMPYTFSVDSTNDGSTNDELTNLTSGRGIGDTFPSGSTITHVSGALIEDEASGAFSSLGIVLTDPANNVVMQIPVGYIETGPPASYPVNCPVGLNYSLNVITKTTVV